MRTFTNYQLILLFFIFITIFVLSKSVSHDDTMDTLAESQSLKPGYSLISKNGKYAMDYGADGTLNVVGIETDENGDIVTDANKVKTNTLWNSRIKQSSNPNMPLTLQNGKLSVYDNKLRAGIEYGKTDEGGGSKLVMLDNGILSLFNTAGKLMWAAPTEGMTGSDYASKITGSRTDLQTKVRDLLQLQSPENKSRMNWNILVNVLWTVVALSFFYFILTN